MYQEVQSQEINQPLIKSQVLIKPFMFKEDKDGKSIIATWQQIIIKEQLYQGIIKKGYRYPSQIQFKGIPLITTCQKDVICTAKSGMGKTALFLISVLETIKPQHQKYVPQQCIIIANTRELVHQIFSQLKILIKFFAFPPLRAGAFIGGTDKHLNSKILHDDQKCPHILVCTLGRLKDLFASKYIQGYQVKTLVIDECDKMLQSRDSRDDLNYIFAKINKNKRILAFTATLNQQTEKDCRSCMKPEPLILKLSQQRGNLQTLHNYYLFQQEDRKIGRLTHLLDIIAFSQVVIFTNTIDRAIKLCDLLVCHMFNPLCIHSKLLQEQRLDYYQLFQQGTVRILVATDIVGRGIDIKKVDLVINYDFPSNCDTFLHRAARAGRFGKSGKTINFLRLSQKIGGNMVSLDFTNMQNFAAQLKIQFQELPDKIDNQSF